MRFASMLRNFRSGAKFLRKSEQDLWFKRLNEDAWNKLPNISIDFTIMEHAPNLCVIPYRGVWSDL